MKIRLSWLKEAWLHNIDLCGSLALLAHAISAPVQVNRIQNL